MATFGGPNTIETGLIISLDAGNLSSYISGSSTYTNLSRGNIVTTATLTNQN